MFHGYNAKIQKSTNTVKIKTKKESTFKLKRRFFLIFVNAENHVGADLIEFAKRYKMMNRELVCAALVTCIHRLRSPKNIGNLLLSFVVVFPQVTQFFDIISVQKCSTP